MAGKLPRLDEIVEDLKRHGYKLSRQEVDLLNKIFSVGEKGVELDKLATKLRTNREAILNAVAEINSKLANVYGQQILIVSKNKIKPNYKPLLKNKTENPKLTKYLGAGKPTGRKFYGLNILEDNPDNPFIPRNIEYMPRKLDKESGLTDVELVSRYLAERTPVLLVGPHGAGKNTLISYIASQTNRPVIRIPFDSGLEETDIVGMWVPTEDGGLEWRDGPLTLAVKHGAIVVLDEINFANPDVIATLHYLLEPNGKLVLKLKGGEVITPHPEFRVVATMNPSGDYAGTKRLNFALEDRFMPLYMDIHNPEAVKKIILDKSNVDETYVNILTAVYIELNNRARELGLKKVFSLRKAIQLANRLAREPDPKKRVAYIKQAIRSYYYDDPSVDELVEAAMDLATKPSKAKTYVESQGVEDDLLS